ncbi:unnamed protein product, partial [Rotaria magnacalcarata]
MREIQEKLTKPESEGSANVTTDPDRGKEQFGFLKFDYTDQTSNGNRLSQFIQLPSNAKEAVVVQFINGAYQLPPPRLILSIQTNSVYTKTQIDKKFSIRDDRKQAILHGLSESIKITSPWVITSGINNDMNRLVGKALNTDTSENYVPCIGLCDWPRGKDLGPLEIMQVESTHSTRDSGEALDCEMGCARQGGNRRQKSSSCFGRKLRRAFSRRETTNLSYNDTTTDSSLL